MTAFVLGFSAGALTVIAGLAYLVVRTYRSPLPSLRLQPRVTQARLDAALRNIEQQRELARLERAQAALQPFGLMPFADDGRPQ